MTLADRIRSANGHPAGFDCLRLLLAVAIILFHTASVCYGPTADHWLWLGPLRPVAFVLVPAFFALSGFLVAGSLLRNDLPSFFMLRMIRIFPALCVELYISAILIGPLFTSLSLWDYFSAKMFWAYWGNLIGRVRYSLPGVFDNLPLEGQVNPQLWTIPFEFECYIALGILAATGLVRQRGFFLLASIGLVVTWTLVEWATDTLPILLRHADRMVVFSFLFGVGFYLLQDRVPHSGSMFCLSVCLFSTMIYHEFLIHLAALPAAYITVYLGAFNPGNAIIRRGADYSYGLYLYGFPIQQMLCALLPEWREWYWNFLLSLPLCLLFAMASWRLVEQPILARRRQILAAVARMRDQLGL